MQIVWRTRRYTLSMVMGDDTKENGVSFPITL
jgi:hypothetical protein